MIIVSIQSTFLNTLFYLALTMKRELITSVSCVHEMCKYRNDFTSKSVMMYMHIGFDAAEEEVRKPRDL